jgi:hypothetical protein
VNLRKGPELVVPADQKCVLRAVEQQALVLGNAREGVGILGKQDQLGLIEADGDGVACEEVDPDAASRDSSFCASPGLSRTWQ